MFEVARKASITLDYSRVTSITTTMLQSETYIPPVYPILTGSFTVDGRIYPTSGFNMLDSKNWPTERGIYAVSGTYEGNDGKILVGKTWMENGFKDRWRHYQVKLRNGNYGNPFLQNSFNKHGIENFVFWTLETNVTSEDLGKREFFWYDHLQSDHTQNGWNLQIPTEDGGRRLAPQTKQKLREINLGNKHSEETKKKMSETRKRDGTWNRGITGPESHFYGRKVSEETRKLISEANTGSRNHHYGKPLDPEHAEKIAKSNPRRVEVTMESTTGERVIFHSVGHMARVIGIDRSHIGWFLATSSVGDVFRGWRLMEEYKGTKKKVNTTRRYRTIELLTPDGQTVQFKKIKPFAESRNLDYKDFRKFLKKASVGQTYYGYQLLS